MSKPYKILCYNCAKVSVILEFLWAIYLDNHQNYHPDVWFLGESSGKKNQEALFRMYEGEEVREKACLN